MLQEALLITGVAGYFGLVIGVGLLELAPTELGPFRNVSVDVSVAFTATVVLVLAGLLAGIFPAWRAAKVRPVVALRDE